MSYKKMELLNKPYTLFSAILQRDLKEQLPIADKAVLECLNNELKKYLYKALEKHEKYVKDQVLRDTLKGMEELVCRNYLDIILHKSWFWDFERENIIKRETQEDGRKSV